MRMYLFKEENTIKYNNKIVQEFVIIFLHKSKKIKSQHFQSLSSHRGVKY
jgi:hypothetical protein